MTKRTGCGHLPDRPRLYPANPPEYSRETGHAVTLQRAWTLHLVSGRAWGVGREEWGAIPMSRYRRVDHCDERDPGVVG